MLLVEASSGEGQQAQDCRVAPAICLLRDGGSMWRLSEPSSPRILLGLWGLHSAAFAEDLSFS